MLEERNLKLDLLALGLLALTIFLAAALLSYEPADPPGTLVYPERAETANVCGRTGALAGQLTFQAFGLGAYYALFSLAALSALLLARRPIDQPAVRTAGWLLSLVGVTTLAAMAVPSLGPGPVIGSGGYLGAAGRGMLELNFASVGAYILAVSLILGGLLLSTDYVLVRLLAWIVGKPTKSFGRGVVHAGMAYAQKASRKPAEVEPRKAEAEEGEKERAIRIVSQSANEEKAEKEPDEKEEAQEEYQEERSASRAARKPFASWLRIKKPKTGQRQQVLEKLDAAGDGHDTADYELPGMDLLLEGETLRFEEQEKEVRRKAKIIEKTFIEFGFNIRVVEIQTGPVVAQFEVELEAGLRLSKITGLADDLAIALRVPSVRIVAPIPGKNTVGIEVPNSERHLVRLREVMEQSDGKASKMRIPIYLGKDVAGNSMVVDLASLPHLLIAGRTGTGKSVCLNSIIISMLMTRRPDEVRLLLIDPKMVELSPYKRLPHLMHPVVTDMRKAEAILAWAVEKMEQRYQLLARAGVRHISVYNQLGEEELMERIQPEDEEDRKRIPTQIPYVVIVADEMADLMMTAAKEVEGHIIRLAQKSRAVGIHLVMATQKPTVDIITGLIKSNLPARICFQVASRTDSRVVLDEMGADKLLGDGDMLFLWPGTSTLIRGQGTYVCDDEISRVIASVATFEPHYVTELVQLKADDKPASSGPQLGNRDELYDAAVDIVIREGRGSVSLLQRTLGIGYGRAARLIDYMAEDGIVGPYNGSQAREVLMSLPDWEAMGDEPPQEPAPTPSRPRSNNRILLSTPAAKPYETVAQRESQVIDAEFEDKDTEADDEAEDEDDVRDEDDAHEEEDGNDEEACDEYKEFCEDDEYTDYDGRDDEEEYNEYDDTEEDDEEGSQDDEADEEEEQWAAESA
ncbi:MAG TPA: DNA translocase FtsK 4TM domain-containing protein [Thermoguttaceae bacterium]|nr:DNA translocase FtsK 4TM domain-containing protein [Thermoguttaceae bacterium]